jgi:hypothetical protein
MKINKVENEIIEINLYIYKTNNYIVSKIYK